MTNFRLSTLTLTLLLVLAGSAAGQRRSRRQSSCPRQCRSCNDGVVDCSDRRLSTPPHIYPDGTRNINLEDNNIRTLGSRSFRVLATLQELKVANNRIAALTNDAFGIPFPNLMRLDLTGNRITRVTRRALRNMGHLRTLTLNQNRIRSLSRIFHGTPNLYQLNLARNHIRRLGQHDLAPLTSVHYIDLRGNQISHFHPKAFKQLDRLRYLFLNNNPIVQMPAMKWGSEVLQMLDMSHCGLTSVPKPLPASITDLRLGNNNIRQVNHTDFNSLQELQILALNENQLEFFADGALSHLSRLTEVWLRNNELVYLPRDLPDNVHRVHMDSNNIQEIENQVFANTSQIHYLNLQNNQINRIHPHTLSELRFLETLNLQGNQLLNLEPSSFAELGSLSTLMLSNNPMTRIEAGAFRNLGNLTQLHLSYITSETFELDEDFLPQMLRLQSLSLMNSPGLAQALMDRLEESGHRTPLNQLRSLDLSYNTLERLPPRVRQVFPSLTSIPLDGNPLRCSRSLQWLAQWMIEESTTVTFANYQDPACETPGNLQGRPLTSISGAEWASDGAGNRRAGRSRGGVRRFVGGVASDQPPETRDGGLYGTLVSVQGGSAQRRYDNEKLTEYQGKASEKNNRVKENWNKSLREKETSADHYPRPLEMRAGRPGRDREARRRHNKLDRKQRRGRKYKKDRKNRKNRKNRDRKRPRRDVTGFPEKETSQ